MDLRDAVEAAVRDAEAKHGGRRDMVIGEFVVIASAHGFDDGESVTQVAIMPNDGSEHRILGLIEHARIRMHSDVLDTYLDD